MTQEFTASANEVMSDSLKTQLAFNSSYLCLLRLAFYTGCSRNTVFDANRESLWHGRARISKASIHFEKKEKSHHMCASYSCLRNMRVTFDVDRYELWLEKLAGISLRQSAAYGLWNFSFNTLYHSTQV